MAIRKLMCMRRCTSKFLSPGLERRHRGLRHGAFTLIEVLVVVAIIALLIAILLPGLKKARAQAQITVCLANLKSIGSAFTMYMGDNRDWLPVGPPDKTYWRYYDQNARRWRYFREPTPGADIFPWSNCHWGGKRAKYIHHYDPERWGLEVTPETITRPLTRYLYPRSSLDNDMPLFHCPSDRGIDPKMVTAFMGLSRDINESETVYEICGNSYYTNPWWHLNLDNRRKQRSPSLVVLAEDATFYIDYIYKRQSKGWHDSHSKHSLLYLDFHAEFRYTDTTKRYGPGWLVENYFDIMDYYY